jgi:NTE family protein
MIFVPVEYQGHMLVDGGLLNPVPIAPTVMNLTDMTIAVSLSGKPEKAFEQPPAVAEQKPAASRFENGISRFIDGLEEKLNLDLKLDTGQGSDDERGLYDIMTRSLEAMQNTVARFKLAAHTPDYTIDIPSNACHLFEFHRASEMIELGYERAGRALASQS